MRSRKIKLLVGVVSILTIWQIGGFNLLVPKASAAEDQIIEQEAAAVEESSNLENLNNSENETKDSSSQLPFVSDNVEMTQPMAMTQDSSLITKIVFTSSFQIIAPGELSNNITIQTQNVSGNPEQVSQTTSITLISSSPTGIFVFGNADHPTPTTITMSTGTANRNFKYKDMTSGIHTLTASGPSGLGWTEGSQVITIDGNPPQISNPLATPNIAKGNGFTTVLLTAEVTDDISGVNSVTVDLSQVGGSNVETIVDDGTLGDVTAGDNIYSRQFSPVGPDGIYHLAIISTDNAGNINNTQSIELTLDTTPPEITNIQFNQSNVLLGIGEGVTITILALGAENNLTAFGNFNGVPLTWNNNGDGSYSATYAVAENDPDGTDVKISDATLTDQAGNLSSPFGPFGAQIDIDAHRPAAPSNLVTKAGDGYVDLSWDEVSDAESYNVYRSQSPFIKINQLPILITSYRDDTVINGETYYYKVTSVDVAGNETDISSVIASLPITPSALASVSQEIIPFGGGEEIAAVSAPSKLIPSAQAVPSQEGQVEAAQQPQAEQQPQKEEEQKKERNWPLIIAIIVAILVVVGGAYYYWSLTQEQSSNTSSKVIRRRKYKRRISRQK